MKLYPAPTNGIFRLLTDQSPGQLAGIGISPAVIRHQQGKSIYVLMVCRSLEKAREWKSALKQIGFKNMWIEYDTGQSLPAAMEKVSPLQNLH